MGPSAEGLLLDLCVAVMVLFDDLVCSHVLVAGASDRLRVLYVLRALPLDGIVGHDLLHGLKLLHIALRFFKRHVIACLAVCLPCGHHHRCDGVRRIYDCAGILLRELHLAALGAHGHVTGLLI